jgi:hypothetical protein
MEAILFFANPSGRDLTAAAIPVIAAPAGTHTHDSTAMDEQQFSCSTKRPLAPSMPTSSALPGSET